MLQKPNSQSPFAHTARRRLGHSKLSLLLVIVTLVVGLMPIAKPLAQQRPTNDEQLQKLLKGTKRAPTIAKIPPEFVAAIKREYESTRDIQKEVSFDVYLANRYRTVMDQIELSGGTFVLPGGRLAAMCADGNCDAPLNPSIWTGAWTGGTMGNITDANLPIATWTTGLVPNNNSISDLTCGDHGSQAHHSIVPNGNDPVIPSLKTVAPRPASGNVSSLRLGNRCPNLGGERVSKTFTVAPGQTTLEFWYAMVAQDPGHTPQDQPGFGAFLIKSDGTPVTGLIDIDPTTPGQQNFIVSDRNNPFFGFDNKEVVFRDWTCVTIDLKGLENQTLTLVLVNRDCGRSGHWGYAYVDSFCLGCGGNPSGDASFNQAKSDCAKGQICFDYNVPKLPNGTTGQATLTLELYQNGSLVNTLTSGPLPSNGTYCFTNVTAGLNPSLGGFDWRAIATFTIPGVTISPKEIGKKGDGFITGKNNDCTLPPPVVFDPCCPPWNKNQLQDALFYQGSGSISAPYTMKFQPGASINDPLKAYVSLLHALNPAVNSVGITFSLHDQGTGVTPATGFGPQLPPGAIAKWTRNSSGIVTGPSITPSAGFFTQPMQVNRWYAVRSVITVPDGPSFVLEKCAVVTIYVRVQVLMNSSPRQPSTITREPAPVLQFSDGQKLLQSIPLNESTQQ